MTMIPEKYGAEHYRSFLSKQARGLYDALNNQLMQRDYSGRTTFRISDPLSAADDCAAAYRAIKDDHPEYFFLGPPLEVLQREDWGTFRYLFLYSADIIERIREQLRKTIYRIVRGTAPLAQIDREELVYKRIAAKLVYSNHYDVRDHNIVGPVLASSGVCEGHNALLIMCYRRIGVPCIKVYGNDDSHCWSIAWINGTPVHCDVTWDGAEEGIVRFNYFNLSDEQISADHHSFAGGSVPECRSTEWNYYHYHRLCVDSHTGLQARLRSDVNKGNNPILLHFGYMPASGDYIEEIRTALSAEKIGGNFKVWSHPALRNYALVQT